jgi:hypothetical protein
MREKRDLLCNDNKEKQLKLLKRMHRFKALVDLFLF